MWIFTPMGLLMPAIVPMNIADAKFTEGKYDLQVRGRSVQHLKNFIDTYMEAGTYHEEIQLNPDMDYNCRFYTTHEAFAAAVAKCIADIDYEKFKPTAEAENEDGTPKWGTKAETATYHSVLNSIWGTVTRIGKPGGAWGVGGSAWSHTKAGATKNYKPGKSWKTPKFSDRDNELWDEQEAFPDYVPHIDSEMDEILDLMDGLPPEQWQENLTDKEWKLVRTIANIRIAHNKRSERKTVRRTQKNRSKNNA